MLGNARNVKKFMNAGKGYFVDSNVLLYCVDRQDAAKRRAPSRHERIVDGRERPVKVASAA